MANWTHQICDVCWVRREGLVKEPHRIIAAEDTTCCFCGRQNKSGIYVRENPKSEKLQCGGDCEKDND